MNNLFLCIFRLRKTFTNKNKKKENHTNNIQLICTKRFFSFKTFKLMLVVCCLFAIQLIIRKIMSFLNLWMLDLWIFNIIFISFFMKIILKIEIYKHQLFSLGINFCINFVLLIVASSLKEDDGNSQFDMIVKNFGNSFYIVLFYLVFLALSAMQCFSQVMQKQFMDIENESPFTIMFMIGIFCTIFTIIALIITTYVNCNEGLIKKGLCSLTQSDNNGYFDSFKIFKNNLEIQYKTNKSAFFIEIFLVYPLYSFACYLNYYCETMIVYRLNPNYVLIADNVYFIVTMIIGIINKLSEKGTILILIGDIISLIAYCFYLEIIQLKCCNFNTRISINERSKIESLGTIVKKEEEDDDIPNVENNNSVKEMIYIKGEDTDNNGYYFYV